MKFLLILSFCVLFFSFGLCDPNNASLNEKWLEYKRFYNKVYENDKIEYERRIIWKSNLDYIEKHNKEAAFGKHTFTLKMNTFGDMTQKEIRQKMNGLNMTENLIKTHKRVFKSPHIQVPDSVDWRTQGYVTAIKNQGQCGSNWAFSAIVSLEGQHFKNSGQLVSLSEQNLVDCSSNFGNQGCNGGFMDQAFDYIKANNGIDTEDSYPYEAIEGKCRFDPKSIGATMTSYVDITSGDENALTAAVATIGPISCAIDASHMSFIYYSSGIYSEPECSTTYVNHGLGIVGYGSLGQDQDYYILKNAWGTDWGEKGFARIARNKNNMCGIATLCSYPVV